MKWISVAVAGLASIWGLSAEAAIQLYSLTGTVGDSYWLVNGSGQEAVEDLSDTVYYQASTPCSCFIFGIPAELGDPTPSPAIYNYASGSGFASYNVEFTVTFKTTATILGDFSQTLDYSYIENYYLIGSTLYPIGGSDGYVNDPVSLTLSGGTSVAKYTQPYYVSDDGFNPSEQYPQGAAFEGGYGYPAGYAFNETVPVTAVGDPFSLTIVASVVPEPTTWALMLVGFGGLGMATRGRRPTAASIA